MANCITYAARTSIPHVLMSNSSMMVFIKVLALATSALATSDRHREFAAWIASHDQDVFGIGMVGFDMSQVPWSEVDFVADRSFLLAVIAAAERKMGWERLDYPPNEEWLRPSLDGFRRLIEAFAIQDACNDAERVWSYGGKPSEWRLCPVHKIYLHACGCVMCHDQSPWMSLTQH